MTVMPDTEHAAAPTQALARRLMWRIVLALSGVTLLLTAFVYWHSYGQAEERVRATIGQVNTGRAATESAAFRAVENDLRLVREVLLGQLSLPRDIPAEFERRYGSQAPGPIFLPTAAALKQGQFDLVMSPPPWDEGAKRFIVAAADSLGRLGPRYIASYQTVFCHRHADGEVIMSTLANYGELVKPKDFLPGGVMHTMSPLSMAEQKRLDARWGPVYQDPFVKTWMLTVSTMIEDLGERISYCAIDFTIDKLLGRTANPDLPGSYNLILNANDELILHPELKEKISAAGGKLNLHQLHDPLLAAIDAMTEQADAGEQARLTPDGRYYLAVSRFEGPGWRFVTLYPAKLVRAEALTLAQATLGAALLGLVLTVLALSFILQREVAKPLARLMAATRRVADGHALDLPSSGLDDEIERLASAMRHMERTLVLRDAHLQARTVELEQEVAERKSRETALKHVSEKLTLAAQAAFIGVWDYDVLSGKLEWDEQMFHMYGYGRVEPSVAFQHWRERIHPEDWPKVKAWLKAATDGQVVHGELEFRILWPDGTVRHINSYGQVSYCENGKPARITGVNVDVTERKLQEARIVHMATHDALTGLPNRSLIHDRILQAMAAGERMTQAVGVLFIDLDRFKTINDSLGHTLGDELLVQASRRLAHCLRKVDTLGRLGGDEFVVILPYLEHADDAEHVVEKILAAFVPPFSLAEHELGVTPSIGLALYPRDGLSAETLIRNADTAMYRAKARGRNCWQAYSADMSEEASETLRVENDLRRALDQDELRLVYQPKVRLTDQALVGAEALVRWHRPGGGIISPDRFIPIAEERGLITAISAWVMREACRQLRAWEDAGLKPVPIAINLDARQFSRPELPHQLFSLLTEYRLPVDWLQLELTESALLLDEHAVRENLSELRRLGFRIAVDDFGTGYSSLSYLHRFPLDDLKIDRSFIHSLSTTGDDASLVSAIIGIGHTLGLAVIAEGVENEDQLEFLKRNRCDLAQGYLFSPPENPDAFALRLEADETRRAG
ncbi:MAG: EAL domain-containing protein [Gammaproteobacteria bacterium]|nr:EAL domain-containing protein [Gammaproteobacteria bacterium]